MIRPPLREYAKAFGIALAAVAGLLVVQGALDRLERDAEDRLAYRKFVADSCIPIRTGESAVATSDGKTLRCTIYRKNTYGFAPVVISAAVMDVPQ